MDYNGYYYLTAANIVQIIIFSDIVQLFVRRKTPGGGGAPIWNRRVCSSEILNLTPKGDHLGVALANFDS